MIKKIICISIIYIGAISAQMAPHGSVYQLLDPRLGTQTYEDKLEAVQTLFIEELFVKHILESQNMSLQFDEPLIETAATNEMMNALFAREIAKILAKQDLLGLKKAYPQY